MVRLLFRPTHIKGQFQNEILWWVSKIWRRLFLITSQVIFKNVYVLKEKGIIILFLTSLYKIRNLNFLITTMLSLAFLIQFTYSLSLFCTHFSTRSLHILFTLLIDFRQTLFNNLFSFLLRFQFCFINSLFCRKFTCFLIFSLIIWLTQCCWFFSHSLCLCFVTRRTPCFFFLQFLFSLHIRNSFYFHLYY